jgi:hypothetical protein
MVVVQHLGLSKHVTWDLQEEWPENESRTKGIHVSKWIGPDNEDGCRESQEER